ncbi:hypothetical protein GCM10009097_25510 [Pigmentiphaga daeguensis]|uniref:Uncharacterized protein n=1 Tax=Pigmentiphaga daeguensis TaxID=414049 RepID=A0ABN1BXY2_9BURK
MGGIQLHMPAQAGHLRGDAGKRPFRRADVVQAGAFQVDAHAPHAAVVQRTQLSGRGSGIDHRDAARPSVHVRQRVEQAAVVGAVDAGLHDDHARHPGLFQVVAQSGGRGRARRVVAVGGHGIGRGGADHVRMAIARQGRQGGPDIGCGGGHA